MVVFTCNNCGESVKKPAVEKHYNTRCRNSPKNVSCMDCQKDFYGDEYVAHTKCISEAEKYSGKNYVAKEKNNSGQKKQETWMDIVRSILESSEYQLSPQSRNIFQRLQNYENVPRKKAKFQNFVKSCLRIPTNQAEPVWKVLEKELEKMKKVKQEEIAAAKFSMKASNPALQDETKQHNGLKRKKDEDSTQDEKVEKKRSKKHNILDINKENGEAATLEETEKFEWCTILEKIVTKYAEGLLLDKLKKKLLKKYKAKLNLEELNEKQQKKFEKKFTKNLNKCLAIKVDNDVAKAC